jgi:hypothetical protein
MVIPCYINEFETIKRFGYDPRRLRPSSERLVVTSCSECMSERIKKFRSALRQRLCLNCSNKINSRNESGRLSRSNKLKEFYKRGGEHPTKGKGHTPSAKLKMSLARKGVRQTLSASTRSKLAEHCQRTLNNALQKSLTAEYNRERMRGSLNHRFGKPPVHTKKVWYARKDGTLVCFRSTWEAIFAAWLDVQGRAWSYESKTFPVTYSLNGQIIDGTYTPDFLAGSVWYEVKGRWTDEGRAKFEAFRMDNPAKRISVIDRSWLSGKGLLP